MCHPLEIKAAIGMWCSLPTSVMCDVTLCARYFYISVKEVIFSENVDKEWDVYLILNLSRL
jgi:hypothetical protein